MVKKKSTPEKKTDETAPKKSAVTKNDSVKPVKKMEPTPVSDHETQDKRDTQDQQVKKVARKTQPTASPDRLMVEKLRELLIGRRDAILRNLNEDRNDSGHAKGDGVGDVVDSAQDTFENEMNFQMAEFGSRELGLIDDALEKIAEGTYGICETCGCSIPLARIKALPFATKCVPCQQAEDSEFGDFSRGYTTNG